MIKLDLEDGAVARPLRAPNVSAVHKLTTQSRDRLDRWLRRSSFVRTLADAEVLIAGFKAKEKASEGFHFAFGMGMHWQAVIAGRARAADLVHRGLRGAMMGRSATAVLATPCYFLILALALLVGCRPSVQHTEDSQRSLVQAVGANHAPIYADSVLRYVSHHAPALALVGVDLVDGSGGTVLRHQTVVIERGRIVEVGPMDDAEIPGVAEVLHLEGYTVIPGFVGMHDHTHMPGLTFMGHTASRLWLASGVTTVQTAGSAEPEAERSLARAIEAGATVGPTLFPTAHYITGPNGNGPMSKPATEAEARALVRAWAADGATWFKLYRHVDPHIAAAVIDEAHALGRKVTGHLCSLTFREAALMGIDSIEHGLISASDFVADKPDGTCVSTRSTLADLDLDDPRVNDLIDLLVQEGVTLTSTLAIIESHFPHRPQGEARALALMAPSWRQRYDERQTRLAEGAITPMTPTLLAKLMAFERLFVEAGGHLVMGPDPGRHVLPGYGNQRGFELLVEAGFTVPEAIQIASANGAEALGVGDEIGRIAEGYLADLVVIKGDLAVEPTAIRNVEIVFKDGIGYDPDLLVADVVGQVGLR